MEEGTDQMAVGPRDADAVEYCQEIVPRDGVEGLREVQEKYVIVSDVSRVQWIGVVILREPDFLLRFLVVSLTVFQVGARVTL